MDKTAEIKSGQTPPESSSTSKQADQEDLAEHVTKRTADAAKQALQGTKRQPIP